MFYQAANPVGCRVEPCTGTCHRIGGSGLAGCRGQCPPNLISMSDCVFRPRASFMTHNVCPAPAIFMETLPRKKKKLVFLPNSQIFHSAFSLPPSRLPDHPMPVFASDVGCHGHRSQSCRVKKSLLCLSQTACTETCCACDPFFPFRLW